jgi:hypothetical protein
VQAGLVAYRDPAANDRVAGAPPQEVAGGADHAPILHIAAIANADVTYYGTADSPNLFRFGPPFTTATTAVNPANGNLAFGSGALTAAAANVESVASPNTTLSNLGVNADERHTLTYSITITTGTTDRDSPWASTLTATNQRARTRVFAF